jgi:hypothetical protein
MKIAVVNFSGNVGKSTIARHLLLPRLPDAELLAVESVNAQEQAQASLRGHQFSELHEYLHTVPTAIVDIGASNLEELLGLMRRYDGSHEDFDCFVVPTVPSLKQQQDTIATLAELASLGVPRSSIRLVFNRVEDDMDLAREFEPVLDFLNQHPLAQANLGCRLGVNEIYEWIRGSGQPLMAVATDTTDYKRLIARASSTAEKLALAQQLATYRLARGVLPQLDACFAALGLPEEVPAQLPLH